jgi:hypothetical protein
MGIPDAGRIAETDLVLDTEGLGTYLQNARQFELDLSACLYEAAAVLRFGIRNMHEGNSVTIATRVTRPFDHAAALHESAAKSLGVVWQRANNLLIPATPKRDPAAAKTFQRKK